MFFVPWRYRWMHLKERLLFANWWSLRKYKCCHSVPIDCQHAFFKCREDAVLGMINDQTWRSSDISSAEDQKPAQPVAGSWRRLTSSNAISWSSAPLGVSAAGSDVWAFLARSPGWPWGDLSARQLSPEGSCPRVTGGLAHASALLILQEDSRRAYLGSSRADFVRFAIRDTYVYETFGWSFTNWGF